MKNLIVVESPAKAKTLSRFLGLKYQTIATMGHIRDLPKKGIGIEISQDFKPKYIVPVRSRKIVKTLKDRIKKADNLILATDFDREGEAIAWHVTEITKPKTEPQRITFHSITKPAILAALKRPRKIDLKLVSAQQTRRILDRLVGYKLSPFLWRKVASGLSAGRVQSVTVRLICDREKEIENFKAEEFWQVIAELAKKTQKKDSFKSFLVAINDKEIDKLGIKTKRQTENIKKDLKEAQWKIAQIEKKDEIRFPQAPFTTSTLQQSAFQYLGFPSKMTMQIAQELYEGVKISQKGRTGLITYHRTDSTNVDFQALNKAKAVIIKKYGQKYSLEKPRQYRTKAKIAQEAHEAIRPTVPSLEPEKIKKDLTEVQFKLYQLIWLRLIASQMKEAVFQKTIVSIKAKKYLFQASGEAVKFEGFYKAIGLPKIFSLPYLKEGELLDLIEILADQKFTQPPARFNEASLIKALEKFGIGRPSTYAPIISTIQDRGYVTRKGGHFFPEEIGRLVTDLLKKHFTKIIDIDFTAKMEADLDKIASGKKENLDFLKKFWQEFSQKLTQKQKEIKKETLIKETTDQKCDECGKPMEVKIGRFGKFLSCTGFPKCKFSKPLIDTGSKKENQKIENQIEKEKCPKCASDLISKEGRFGPFLACSKYPKCKFTKSLVQAIGMKCPECGQGEVIIRRTKKGKVFWGCSKYPNCRWASWTKPDKNDKIPRQKPTAFRRVRHNPD